MADKEDEVLKSIAERILRREPSPEELASLASGAYQQPPTILVVDAPDRQDLLLEYALSRDRHGAGLVVLDLPLRTREEEPGPTIDLSLIKKIEE